ncbi:MAG: hypothetical protein UR50_C0006G0002 [Parcubacteria group bacterium GW2011_GWC1_34_10]|uniref:HTH deoR-type domain-containing protein n=1 Tax=Candidatus Zambryskibacteria bacterium RIFCSPLOWO2_01_FULL_35_19 TaxID=1802757 RepID=A0A1G2TVF0_9BACT|nr:MAG: hypothetical protein UR50_C0006G0002 [Parcubacteria group bacterium GW2011_GWC1_34_10]OHA86010.1 MAG: hypothetical protein A2726_01245 [Candidatus Zambryskibacteria bacterium RIFCSPHIGHO2_01_FULL_35_32]OHB01184.1 MAG: hypothetical protein A3A90_01530 [Candidatus Zambryskibacteria bacterium RIFCSPLOWO2_01_FULL_35_19]
MSDETQQQKEGPISEPPTSEPVPDSESNPAPAAPPTSSSPSPEATADQRETTTGNAENPTPNQSSQTSDDTGQVSEANSAPVSPYEPTEQAPSQAEPSNSAEASLNKPESSPNPESAVMVKNPDDAKAMPGEANPAPPPPPPSLEATADQREATAGQGNEPLTPASEPLEQPTQTAQIPVFEPLPIPPSSKPSQKDLWRRFLEKVQVGKRKKIDKILTLFSEKKNGSTGSPQVTNDEVEKLLHVSDATATRYLETLEKEGKIRQVGKTGKGVVYVLLR